MSCIFCRIAQGEIPSHEVYRDERVLAIADLNPQAPEHLLVMPVEHVANVAELAAKDDEGTMAALFAAAARLGQARLPRGFRLVVNTGVDGGQTVEHLHVHVLGGRTMHWPPG